MLSARARRLRLVLLGLGFLGLALVRLAPLSLHPGTRLADDGDAAQGAWILWSASRALARGGDLFAANAYFPHPQGLLYSEPLLTQAVLAWPILRLTGDAVLANNIVLLLSLAASALAAHVLLREYTESDVASACGALTYAFSTYATAHLPQLQLVSLQWMPLALLFLRRVMSYARLRDAACLVAFSLLHALSCLYYLLFYLVTAAVLAPLDSSFAKAVRSRRALGLLGTAAAVSALVLLPVAGSYLSLYDRFAFTGEPDGIDLLGFVLPPRGGSLDGMLPAFEGSSTGSHALGPAAVAVAALGLVSLARSGTRDRSWLGFLLLGSVSSVLAAGPEVFLGGRFLFRNPLEFMFGLPVFSSLRSANRFALLVTLALAFFVAHGVKRVLSQLAGRRRLAVAALLSFLFVAETWSPCDGAEVPWGPSLPEAYSRLAALPDDQPLAELPVRPFRDMRFTSLEALFATVHRHPILFAKPSYYPPALELLQWELRDFPDSRSVTLLGAIGVRLALVHPHRFRHAEVAQLRFLARHDERLPLLERFPDRANSLWRRYALGAEELRAVPPLEVEGRPREWPSVPIPRDALQLRANGVNDPRLAVDGNVDTRWTTGRSQHEGHYLEVRLDRPRMLGRIEIEMAYPWGEFARHLRFEGLLGERMERLERVEDIWYTAALVRRLARAPKGARLRYDFTPALADGVRLVVERTEEAVIGWSVPELHLYELGYELGGTESEPPAR